MSAVKLLPPPPVDLPDGSVQALVFDPHAVSRIGLGVLLHRQKWVSRCLLAADRDEATALVERHKPDVAIVDVSTAAPFVPSYLAPLRSAHPAMPILLSSRCQLAASKPPSSIGVIGILTPGYSAEEVLVSVRAALVGDELPSIHGRDEFDKLSGREREVLALMSTGATNREIAAVMHVGTETVKKHAGALYRKLGVRNRTEAAQRAAELLAA
ncbi:MAG: response regulator transcription factor [Solirubrobacteraceae bacterium]